MSGEEQPPGTVECYSGAEYAEEPRKFYWDGSWRRVGRIAARRRSPEGKQFIVEDERGESFVLTYETGPDRWIVRPAP
jgi:hypothetical protein